MVEVIYRIVEHDGGWAYKVGDVFSETFPTRAAAEAVARQAAAEQGVPGDTETISWQDAKGRWHEEREPGSDRPRAYVAGVEPRPAAGAPAAAADWASPQARVSLGHLILAGVVGACLAVLLASRRQSST